MFAVAHKTPASESACEALASAGATTFELDVRLHSSGVIVSHFLPVLRIPGWLENDQHVFRLYRRSPRDPYLFEFAEHIPRHCRVLLDLKEDVPWRRRKLNEKLVELIDRDRYLVSTHIVQDLQFFRERGFETWRTIRSSRELAAAIAGDIADAGVSIRHSLVNFGSLSRLRHRTNIIVAWTINDVESAQRLIRLNVDGITTDSPDIMSMTKPTR